MRVADYIAQFVWDLGVEYVFTGAGGGMLYLADGVHCHPKLQAVSCHHEQAAGYAAVGYAKQKGKLGVCMGTTGCGSTNTVTAVLDAYQDSDPVLFISGQDPVDQTIRGTGAKVRQLGVQEVDMVSLVHSITKYAAMVLEPHEIAFQLELAVDEATRGRPGPVWLEIPQDVQQAEIEPSTLVHYNARWEKQSPGRDNVDYVWGLLAEAKHPLLIVGHGVRLADAMSELDAFLYNYRIPMVSSFMGTDLAPNYPLYLGCIGYKGNHAANLAVENADVVVSVGCRLSLPAISFLGKKFAPNAQLVVVDIDQNEHLKDGARIDKFIKSDARLFLQSMNKYVRPWETDGDWLPQCEEWKAKWPVWKEGTDESAGVDVYHFLDALAKALPHDGTVVCDAGSTFFAVGRGFPARDNQRVLISGAQTDMGFALPGAIGACFAGDGKRVVAIQGDGSFQFNLQELQTLVHHNLPVVLFVWNNDGYLSIRASQDKSCKGRHTGTDSTCGISFPSIARIADAYGVKYYRLNVGDMEERLAHILAHSGPVLCEVMCQRDQVMVPKED